MEWWGTESPQESHVFERRKGQVATGVHDQHHLPGGLDGLLGRVRGCE